MQRAQAQPPQGIDMRSSTLRPVDVGPTGNDSDIGDLWRILSCRRMLIACTLAACTLAAIVYVVVTPLQFTASAQILIDPRDRQILNKDVTPDTLAADGGVLQVESQSRLIESDTVLLDAVRSLNLANDPAYGLPPNGLVAWFQSLAGDSMSDGPAADEDRALRALRKHLAIKRADKVFVVDIIVTASSGEKAARIADAIAEAYLADQAQARAHSSSRASEALVSQLDDLRASVTEAAEKVERFKVAHDLLGTDKQSISDQQLNDNGAQLDAAHARVAELQARADQIDALRKTGLDGGAMPEAIQSAVITQLRASQDDLVRKRSDMRTRFGDRYPDLIAVNAQIEQAHRQIETELERLARSAHSDLDRAKKNEQALETLHAKLKSQTASNNQSTVTLRQLQRELDARRDVYQSFLSRAGETREQSKVDNTNARIISRAIPPVQPSWPLRAILLLAGPAAGVGLGVALAFVLEYLAPTILSAAHLSQATGTPVIGTILRRPKRRGSDAVPVDPVVTLGLNRLCGPLTRLQDKPRPHTVLVAAAREAATMEDTISTAMVEAGIEGGVSVLLVKAPKEARTDEPAKGFLNVLNGECTMLSALTQDRMTGHYRLDFGTSIAPRRDVWMNRQFGSFLGEASRMFELIIFEGGNVAEDPGVAPLAACVDDVLFIALSGRTKQKEAVEAAEAITASAGRPLSAALLLGRGVSA